ncbi:autophagy-related protein 13a-like [Cornus florida]|uniref:autophagy-related protein 13a-like n=1 Tax=Cornus florida TaxID=4283 RepID=UPI00289FAA7C|nr:autophagy-related protein 13a-like [Cornus florida]
MDLQSNHHTESGRFEQIVSQFLLKSLHIILDSRVPSIRRDQSSDLSLGTQVKKSDKWFSLVLGDRPAALDNFNFWRRNLTEPMIIDIILVREGSNSLSECNPCSSLGLGKGVETVIERWVVQYEHLRTMYPQMGEPSASYKKTYKKSIILLRALYSMMRLLPAYRPFQKLCSSSQAFDFDINYKVSSFCAPFSRAAEEVMKQYSLSPVDAPQGRLSISVMYRASLSDFNLETSSSFPPQIIMDYVGSPATDPLRAFPLSGKVIQGTSIPSRGIRSPSSAPFQRPHSWTSGFQLEAPLMKNQPLGGSPPVHRMSTMAYDFPSSPTDIYGHRIQNYRLPTHHKATSSIDHQLSPPFSPSPSPSPPTYLSGNNPMQSRLRSETAPVSIPHPMMGRSPRYLSPNLSDPNRHSLPPLSPRSTKHDPSSQDSPSGSRLLRKSESQRSGELNSGMANHYSGQKMLKDSKDDSGRFSALLSSSGSPRIGFSSSIRLPFQDDLDDGDFSCPFIVDDVDTSDSPVSQNLDGQIASEFTSQPFSTTRKSQDAAVGALVHMLRTAPPLRQDSSCYSSHSSKIELEGEVGAESGFFVPRKTSDALEELRGYREMKDLLHSKNRIQAVSKEAA